MRDPVHGFWWFVSRELASPINIIVAILVGALVNVGTGHLPWYSWVPYATPMVVQVCSKAIIRYRQRYDTLLLQLPAWRTNPAFVISRDGTIIASSGYTRETVERLGVTRLEELVLEPACPHIAADARSNSEIRSTCYSDLLRAWFDITLVPAADGASWLVWMDNATSRVLLDERLKRLRIAIEHLPQAVPDLIECEELDSLTASLAFADGFRAVFIARRSDGGATGRLHQRRDGATIASEPLHVIPSVSGAVFLSTSSGRVALASRGDEESTDDFLGRYRFDDRLVKLVSTPIDNFATYHHDDVVVTLLNRVGGLSKADEIVVETILNTAGLMEGLLCRPGGPSRTDEPT